LGLAPMNSVTQLAQDPERWRRSITPLAGWAPTRIYRCRHEHLPCRAELMKAFAMRLTAVTRVALWRVLCGGEKLNGIADENGVVVSAAESLSTSKARLVPAARFS
jgi:hypothetical protein